jgi:striatin 1/3/4
MMGPNVGNGVGGMEMGMGMHPNGPNQPQATEYTLQGVMRFLQTEWHRHERERNAWEIEKQEMRGRIANLEGQARRADATQKALRKYVTILERKVKNQAAQLKGTAAIDADEEAKNDRAAKIQDKLRGQSDTLHSLPLYQNGILLLLTNPSQLHPTRTACLVLKASRSTSPMTTRKETSSGPSSTNANLNSCI